MVPYYIAYGLTVMAGLFCVNKKNSEGKRNNTKYFILFAVIWIFLLGLRHPSMGADLSYGSPYGYLGRFELISSIPWRDILQSNISNYERGYIVFNKMLSILGNDYTVLLLGCATFSISLIAYWLCKNSDYPVLSAIIYLGLPCFMINFSGLRQSIAIAITTLSIEAIRQKRKFLFISLVSLACTFHYSAWIFIFAYPIYHIKMEKLVSLSTILIPAIFFTFRYPLFAALSKLFKVNAQPDDNGAFMLFLIFWLIYFFAVVFGHEKDREELGLRNMLLVACVCQAMGGVYSTVLRVGYYFMASTAVLLPKIIKNNRQTFRKIWKNMNTLTMYVGIMVCFAVFGLYSLSRESWSMSNPYMFFWQV